MGRNLFHCATDILGGYSGGRVPAPTARLAGCLGTPSTASVAPPITETPCTWGGDEFVSPRPGRGRRLRWRCRPRMRTHHRAEHAWKPLRSRRGRSLSPLRRSARASSQDRDEGDGAQHEPNEREQADPRVVGATDADEPHEAEEHPQQQYWHRPKYRIARGHLHHRDQRGEDNEGDDARCRMRNDPTATVKTEHDRRQTSDDTPPPRPQQPDAPLARRSGESSACHVQTIALPADKARVLPRGHMSPAPHTYRS